MNLDIDIDVTAVAQSLGRSISSSFALTLPALAEAEAEFLLERWRAAASGQVYPGMTRPFFSQRYQMALMRTSPQQISGGVEIYVGNSGGVDFGRGPFDFVLLVERGRGPVDLKVALSRGRGKTRKDGQRYLIIPFRHGSGESVHFQSNINPAHFTWTPVSRRPTSARFGPAERGTPINPWTAAAIRQPHAMGRHVSIGTGPMHTKNNGYTWQRALLEGVQRTSTPGHQSYQTFRTISPDSDPAAWILPAMQPNPIFESTVRATAPLIRQHIEDAIRRQPTNWWSRIFRP